jgi:hypothetical protein
MEAWGNKMKTPIPQTFLISDEDELIKYLARKAWNDNYVTEDDKKLQERMRKENEAASAEQFNDTLNVIKKSKSKPGDYNWEYLRRHQPKKYEKLMKEKSMKERKMIEDKFSETVVVVA